jgi:hypothetical protein
MDDEMGRTRKEAVVTYFLEYSLSVFLKGLK